MKPNSLKGNNMFLSVRTEWNEVFILIGVRWGAIWLQKLCLSALSLWLNQNMKYSIIQLVHLKPTFLMVYHMRNAVNIAQTRLEFRNRIFRDSLVTWWSQDDLGSEVLFLLSSNVTSLSHGPMIKKTRWEEPSIPSLLPACTRMFPSCIWAESSSIWQAFIKPSRHCRSEKQHNMGRGSQMGCGSQTLCVRILILTFLAVWPWVSHLAFLYFSSIIRTIGKIIVSNLIGLLWG